MEYFVHESSYIDENVKIGKETKIWHFCHIQSGAVIGENCSLGQNVNISNNVKIGNRVKIQNNVSVYEGVELEDEVFCGPSCVFTNDLTPRASYPKEREHYKKTIVKRGATIGANATIVCGHKLGEWCMVAAGAVVTKSVPAYALVAGVPAKQMGWVCECGQVLDEELICMNCEKKYKKLKDSVIILNCVGGVIIGYNFKICCTSCKKDNMMEKLISDKKMRTVTYQPLYLKIIINLIIYKYELQILSLIGGCYVR